MEKKADNCIDIIKFICCLMIVGMHIHPLLPDPDTNFFFQEYIFRIGVPFFFISTGFFFAGMDDTKRKSYIKRLLLIYAASSILYLPFYIHDGIGKITYYLLTAYHHLWYLNTLALSLIIIFFADKMNPKLKYFLFLLFPVAIFFENYCRLIGDPSINDLSTFLETSGIDRYLKAIPSVLMGVTLKDKKIKTSVRTDILLFVILMAADLAEVLFLRSTFGIGVSIDVSFFGWAPAIPLLLFGIKTRSFLTSSASRTVRKTIDLVYILHILIIMVASGALQLQQIPLYLVTLAISFLLSGMVVYLMASRKKAKS